MTAAHCLSISQHDRQGDPIAAKTESGGDGCALEERDDAGVRCAFQRAGPADEARTEVGRGEKGHVLAEARRAGRSGHHTAAARAVRQNGQRGRRPDGGQIDTHRAKTSVDVVGQQQQAAPRWLAAKSTPLDVPCLLYTSDAADE